mmetsp:Transcript_24867/g.35639  ORF Transcript_24867/g.35639 Transcript_24867/m.35639 type:complete len:98 (+) Transcript_24867:116-409(+)
MMTLWLMVVTSTLMLQSFHQFPPVPRRLWQQQSTMYTYNFLQDLYIWKQETKVGHDFEYPVRQTRTELHWRVSKYSKRDPVYPQKSDGCHSEPYMAG